MRLVLCYARAFGLAYVKRGGWGGGGSSIGGWAWRLVNLRGLWLVGAAARKGGDEAMDVQAAKV